MAKIFSLIKHLPWQQNFWTDSSMNFLRLQERRQNEIKWGGGIFWGHLHFWDCLHFWGGLHFWGHRHIKISWVWHCSAKVKSLSVALLIQALALLVTMSSMRGPPIPLPKAFFQNVHIGLKYWAPDRHIHTQTAVDMEVPPELKKQVLSSQHHY